MSKEKTTKNTAKSMPIEKRLAKIASGLLFVTFATYGLHELLVRYAQNVTGATQALYNALTAVFMGLLLYIFLEK